MKIEKEVEKAEKLDCEKQDLVVKAMQEELSSMVDGNGKLLPHMEKYLLRAICQMAAFSLTPQRIANNVGMPTHRIKAILGSVSMQREISRVQSELYERDAVKMFKKMVPAAAQTVYGLLGKADKDSTRVEAAKVILDRAFGKPTQTIEQTTTLIKEVLVKLNNEVRDEKSVEEAELVPLSENKEEKKAAQVDDDKDPIESILVP